MIRAVEEIRLAEVHRLAVEGRNQAVASRAYVDLAERLRERSLHRELYAFAQATLSVVEDGCALNDLGIVAAMRGEVDASLGFFDRSLEIDRAGLNSQYLASSLHNVAMLIAELGQYDRAWEMLVESGELVSDCHDIQGVGENYRAKAYLLAMTGGDRCAVDEMLTKALDIAIQGGWKQLESTIYATRVDLDPQLSTHEKTDLYQRAYAAAVEAGDLGSAVSALNRGGDEWMEIDPEKAKEQYILAANYLRGMTDFGARKRQVLTKHRIACALFRLGELDQAREAFDAVIRVVDEVGDTDLLEYLLAQYRELFEES